MNNCKRLKNNNINRTKNINKQRNKNIKHQNQQQETTNEEKMKYFEINHSKEETSKT